MVQRGTAYANPSTVHYCDDLYSRAHHLLFLPISCRYGDSSVGCPLFLSYSIIVGEKGLCSSPLWLGNDIDKHGVFGCIVVVIGDPNNTPVVVLRRGRRFHRDLGF